VVAINRRAAESDLLIYVNINLVPMDGGHKSVGTGLANYASLYLDYARVLGKLGDEDGQRQALLSVLDVSDPYTSEKAREQLSVLN